MKKLFSLLACGVGVLILTVSAVFAEPIDERELEDIKASYKRWWGADLEMRFDHLPRRGMVEKHRMPWAGHIYPDTAGGCEQVLRVYDYAFHGGRSLAASYERHDIAIHQTGTIRTVHGLFGRTYTTRSVGTPHWAGHCNGWTAAAIRHAEPRQNVTRNGVVFTPATIKGLLAELYVYGDIETLGGAYDNVVHPGTLHLTLANWIGAGQHPIAMDNTLGTEIWNYPIYSYRSSSARIGNREVEVKTNIGFINSTDREYNRAPKRFKFLYFHYWLELDSEDRIVGGGYYRDSNMIDLLWVPLQPPQRSDDQEDLPGNPNPYLDTKVVLSLWRDSVPREHRDSWYNADPWPEDAIRGHGDLPAEDVVVDGPPPPPSRPSATSR